MSELAATIPTMRAYEITYRILPAGVGPDDYEPGDLEQHVERYELSDPEPTGVEVAGVQQHYGPHKSEAERAIRERHGLEDGALPMVSEIRSVD